MRQRVRGSSGSSRAGSVLVPALLVVVMMSALCMSYVQLSLTKNRESQIGVDSKRAFYMAESGLAEGYFGLARGKSGVVASENVPARFGNGVYWVTAEEHGDRVTLKSTGLAGLGRSALSLTLQKARSSVAALGMYADQRFTLARGALIDAWDSRQGAYAPSGGLGLLDLGGSSAPPAHVGCNASITLAGASGLTPAARILGDAVPGPSGSVVLGVGATVTGSTAPSAQGNALPALEVVVPADAPAHEVTRTEQLTGSALAYGSLHVHAGATLRVQGPAELVLDSLVLDRGATLEFDSSTGNVQVSVRSYADLPAGSTFRSIGNATERTLLAVAGSQSVDRNGDGVVDPPLRLAASGDFYGTIYAPGAALALPSSFTVFGSVVAGSIALGANARLHFDRALLQAIASGSLPELVCWRVVELPPSDLVRLGFDPLTVLRVNGVTPVKPADAHYEVGSEPLGILRSWLAPVTNLLH